MSCSKASESAGRVVNSQSSQVKKGKLFGEEATPHNRPECTRTRLFFLDQPLTRSIALTPDNVWFVDLQWYRKIEPED